MLFILERSHLVLCVYSKGIAQLPKADFAEDKRPPVGCICMSGNF